MSCLLKRNQQLHSIYHLNDQLFYKVTPNRNNRSITLARNATPTYTATLDNNNQIHIVYKNNENKITHLYEISNTFHRNVILDDTTNTYNINDLKLVSDKKDVYLFYKANNPYEHTFDLIFHKLGEENSAPQSILSLINSKSSFDVILINNKIHIICCNRNQGFELNNYSYDTITEKWLLEDTLCTQTTPIQYTSICKDNNNNNLLHVIFATEQFGSYQVYYINSITKKSKLLYTSPYDIKPIIFKYKSFLWINWIESNTNNLIFSTNDGESFSNITKASLQLEQYELINFISNDDLLQGNKYYGISTPTPTISILSQIDFDNLLAQDNTNTELNIIIDSLASIKAVSATNYHELLKENKQLKEVQKNIEQQYNNLSDFAKKLQEEGKRWKNKNLKHEMEIKKLKNSVKPLMPPKDISSSTNQKTEPQPSTHQPSISEDINTLT